MLLFTIWARAILPTAAVNLHHLCVAMVCKQKPPARGLEHMAALRMEWKCIREAEGAPQNNNKNMKMQSILRF